MGSFKFTLHTTLFSWDHIHGFKVKVKYMNPKKKKNLYYLWQDFNEGPHLMVSNENEWYLKLGTTQMLLIIISCKIKGKTWLYLIYMLK